MGEAAGEALVGTLRDRYVGLPLDLTGVLFVAVATNPGRIPLRRAFPAAGSCKVARDRRTDDAGRDDVGALARRPPLRRRPARRFDGRPRAPRRSGPVDGRPVRGGDAGRALVFALTGQVARVDGAMSGELTLAGMIEPVGGIQEKVLGAYRARMTTVLLPSGNEADVAESFGDELPGGAHGALRDDDGRRSRGGAARRRSGGSPPPPAPTRAEAGESDPVPPGPPPCRRGQGVRPRLLSTLSSCGQDRLRRLHWVRATPLHIAAVADVREVVAVPAVAAAMFAEENRPSVRCRSSRSATTSTPTAPCIWTAASMSWPPTTGRRRDGSAGASTSSGTQLTSG